MDRTGSPAYSPSATLAHPARLARTVAEAMDDKVDTDDFDDDRVGSFDGQGDDDDDGWAAFMDVSGGADRIALRSQRVLDQFWASDVAMASPQSSPSPWWRRLGSGYGYESDDADDVDVELGRNGDRLQMRRVDDGWILVEPVSVEPPDVWSNAALLPPYTRGLVTSFGCDPVLAAMPEYLESVVAAHGTQRSKLKAACAHALTRAELIGVDPPGHALPLPGSDGGDAEWLESLTAPAASPEAAARLSLHSALSEWSRSRLAELTHENAKLAAEAYARCDLRAAHLRMAQALLTYQAAEATAFARLVAATSALAQAAPSGRALIQDELRALLTEHEAAITDLRAQHESQLAALDSGGSAAVRATVLEAQAADIVALRNAHAEEQSARTSACVAAVLTAAATATTPRPLPRLYDPLPEPSTLLPPLERYGLDPLCAAALPAQHAHPACVWELLRDDGLDWQTVEPWPGSTAQ
ncbi:uncharacterized protein AMSG_09247 [Thecamonas trahens ATCC 50062]|uniref:Uncharacterized protein n=1 Tax=Thecamonas trahens ATCC 50062 TaxID=461836 RepID=A0A0L0DP28_THETB|nr:hypothetical protein AMSG_09247 [Thecamonas trahens ATCC 50062]KNC53168.1 hypothetical protein AMSG_09247 [Thecamonas trahens ATCC 50062]|eukprot:XP_013754641.1 hypothetical protein AMSG_09247 [Thecamonas trahens ATCC 50062]